MQTYNCLIIEDEPLAVNILKAYIRRIPYLVLQGSYKDAIQAGAELQQKDTDILFLDIHLPELNGLDFLRNLERPPVVIVTTAYHEYAIESFELNVIDYLLKPISFERFLKAVTKGIKQSEANKFPEAKKNAPDNFIFLTIDRRKVKLLFDDIDYIESSREYVKIFTVSHDYTCKMSTTELEKMLPPDRFRRIHRSFIISLEKIDAYTKGHVEIRGKKIPVGADFKKDIGYFNKP